MPYLPGCLDLCVSRSGDEMLHYVPLADLCGAQFFFENLAKSYFGVPEGGLKAPVVLSFLRKCSIRFDTFVSEMSNIITIDGILFWSMFSTSHHYFPSECKTKKIFSSCWFEFLSKKLRE